jgi:voltage-gated potassium channel
MMRPDLTIVARANSEDSIPKLRQAGADRVISPYAIGGRRMALAALRPVAVEYVDTILRGDGIEVLLEDIELTSHSPLVGLTVGDFRARYSGITLMALRRGKQFMPNPPANLRLEVGDQIVALGVPEQLRALEGVA